MTGELEVPAVLEPDAAPQTVNLEGEPVAPLEEEKQAERTYTEKELQERIQARAAKEERKFNRQLKAELERERQQIAGLYQKLQEPPKADSDGRPSRANYTDDEKFIEDLTAWKAGLQIKEELSKRDQQAQESAQVSEAEKLSERFNERAKSVLEKYPDFLEKVTDEDLIISKPMARQIALAENGPDVAYYLSNNPEVSAKIAQMHPLDAAMELGKISAGLVRSGKQISSAPAPVKPVASAKALASDLANSSQEEYEAMRRKQGARW